MNDWVFLIEWPVSVPTSSVTCVAQFYLCAEMLGPLHTSLNIKVNVNAPDPCVLFQDSSRTI